MPFVLDSSVALAWVLPDESDAPADAIVDRLVDDTAIVPAVWPFEVANVLLVARRRGRLTRHQAVEAATRLRSLPILVDARSADADIPALIELAERSGLSAYDATYVELARRIGTPLATLDRPLRQAARMVGVAVIP